MTTNFQPPPTYADPVIVDETTRKGQFNPIWLKWFLDLSQFINNNGGGGTIQHNTLGGLQGGAANEYYHLNQATYTIINNIGTPTAGSVAYGTGSTVGFTAAGLAGQVLTSAGTGTPVWTSLSGTAVTSFSAGTTGLTPSTPTTGAVVLAGTLKIANGGTNGTATPTAGAVAFGTGTAYSFTLAGTSGYFLKSGGSGTPTWSNSIGGYVVDSTTPYLDWGDGTAVTLAAGRMWYNGTTGSWNLGMGNGNITQQVGEEIFVYGKASATITDSPLQIIRKTGTVGASGVITFGPTIAGLTESDVIIGVATESIATNGFGRITAFGVVHGITTNGTAYGEVWADNDDIWYNPTTGNPTKTKPNAPGIKVRVGTVINAGSGGSGSFQVLLQPGSTLGGTDSNVQFGTLANGNLIQYNSTLQYWTNVTVASVVGANVVSIGSLANATGWLYNNGSGTFSYSTPSKSDVGLGNVSNDTQTKASIVPNTAPSAGQLLVGNAGGTAYAPVSMSGDATIASTGAITVSKFGGTAFGTAAGYAATAFMAAAAPVTYTANFSVATTDVWIINNKSGSSCTATLPTASANTGRVLRFQNYQAQTLISASSNVVPLVGGAAGTAILNAVAGDTATLVSDGTNWLITQYTPNNVLLLE